MQICKYSYSDTNLKMPIITCATGALFRAMAICSYKDNICPKFCSSGGFAALCYSLHWKMPAQ